MPFQKIISDYIRQQNMLRPAAPLLVAVSGGADSVALLHVMLALGYQCQVAHCNFHLRGAESDRDELFVEKLAARFSLPYYKVHFDTTQYAADKGISIEMAARDLRYTWFEQLRKELNLDAIAVAHHSDDVVETFFMNLLRGTGLHGLTGIKPIQGRVVRPLLCVGRLEILDYLSANNMTYVTDSSNLQQVYTRNKFRHTIIPQMEEINPSLKQTVCQEIERLKEAEMLYNERIEELKALLIEPIEGGFAIHIKQLMSRQYARTVLYEIMSPYGFSSQQIPLLEELMAEPSGKQIYSATHRVVKHRDKLLVCQITPENKTEYKIEKQTTQVEQPVKLTFSLIPKEKVVISKQKNRAYFDAGQIEYPLTLRPWREGDYFHPFGMKGKKKISDYFIDQKYSLLQKEQTYLLLSGKNVIWIVGERADNRFRITADTQQVFCVTCEG